MRAGRDETSSKTTRLVFDVHKKSCDRCGLKKRKCDGENPCGRCVRLGETCIHSKRRSRANRPQAPGAVYVSSASDPSVHAPSTLQGGRGVSPALLQHYGRVSLKRCRLSPSPATGLVGMQENMFLSDYFGCVGFLPFTSQSNIRETMVNMFSCSATVQHSDSGIYSTTEQHLDTIPANGQLPADPSTCVFWCAVALGALAKGRPIESVEKYSRLAREALANFEGPVNTEVGRAWAILAYMSGFCGDRDNFHQFVKRANDVLCDVQQQENETLPEGLSEVVKHGETIRIFVGDVNKEEVESFVNQERAIPQITQAATEGEICKFVMQSYRSFEQALYPNVVELRFTSGSLGSDGEEPSVDIAPAEPVADGFLKGSKPHFITSLIREQQTGSSSSGILDMIITMLRNHSRQFEQIENAAGRMWLLSTEETILLPISSLHPHSHGLVPGSNIRDGIGGLIINGTVVFERISRNDISGALGNLENCGEVFQRYPGLCRFTMGAHMTHMLLANLAVIDGPRARVVYDKMRTAYNSALLAGTPAIPPFEEWQGVSACCDNYNCRLMEFMVNIEHGAVSPPPPPEEPAAEIHERGPREVPVHGREQGGFSSATGSGEGAEGSSAFDARNGPETLDASKPNVGCMENVSFDGGRNAMMQPQGPTLTPSSIGREDVGSEPIVDSDVCRVMNGQSSSDRLAEFGPQVAEALLLSELSRGRALTGETEDDSIDVEDWLDVTHAMLDTSVPGLGLE